MIIFIYSFNHAFNMKAEMFLEVFRQNVIEYSRFSDEGSKAIVEDNLLAIKIITQQIVINNSLLLWSQN